MSNNPNEIRRDIERTRAELSDNVTALGDSAKPSNIVREQVEGVKDSVRSVKERIFGSDADPYDDGALGDATHRVGDALSDARDSVADAPRQVRASTRGNPLAAGLIAAGVGALIGGLLPTTRMEKERAVQLKEAAEPAIEQVKEMAAEAKEHLQPMAEEAAEGLKGVVQTAGDHLKSDAQLATDEVKEQAQFSAETVKTDAQDQLGTDADSAEPRAF